MATAHKSRVLDMTQGDPFRLVLQFSMPLFCSNLLQQLYNLTDTALAGHLLGSAALAEIGATAALYGLIMNFAFGMNNGLALTVSRYFGAGDESGIRRAVGWMVTLSAAVSLVLTAMTHSTGLPSPFFRLVEISSATAFAKFIVFSSRLSRTPPWRPSIVGRIPIFGYFFMILLIISF